MQAFLFIANRYLRTIKKRKIIHFIGLVASASMCISTAAIILSTGIYNGLESMVHAMLKSIDSDIRIKPKKGKTFNQNIEIIKTLQTIQGISTITEVLANYVILANEDTTTLAYLQGSKSYRHSNKNLNNCTIAENKTLHPDENGTAKIGSGVANAINLRYLGQTITVLYPKNQNLKKFNLIHKLYNNRSIQITEIFSIDKQQDDKYILTSLYFAQKLMDKTGIISSINIDLAHGESITTVQKQIKTVLNDDSLSVKTIHEDQKTLLKALKIEKLCTKIVFFIIMLIAAINIFFALSMLIIIKREDLHTLYTLGATKKTIFKIFMLTGFIISLRGAVVGSIIAYVLYLVQQKFGIISLGAVIGNTDVYPIKLHFQDFFYTSIAVIFTTIIASLFPILLKNQFKN